MNRQYISYFILLCFIFTTPIFALTENKRGPIKYQPHHVTDFSSLISSPEFSQEILPNDFSSLIKLLNFAKKTYKSPAYMQQVFSLFQKLLKGVTWVNSYAFDELIIQLPSLLDYKHKTRFCGAQKLFSDMELLERFQKRINPLLFTNLTQGHKQFKQYPEKFLDELTNNLAQVAYYEVSSEMLRQSVTRFLETAIDRLVWSPNDEANWDMFKNLSMHVTTLYEQSIIDENNLDDIYWSLVHRFNRFMGLMASDLSFKFYQKVKESLETDELPIFALEEQESFMRTKRECFISALLESHARKLAYA